MTTPETVARAYLETWNETGAEPRRALLDAHWTADAAYADPLMRGDGVARIDALIAAVHERFPGFRFRAKGTPDGWGEHVRLAWTLGPAGGEAPIEGSDLIRLRDGRIAEVIGFIDRAPAAG